MSNISSLRKNDDSVFFEVLSRNIIPYSLLLSVFVSGNGVQLEDFTFYWYHPLYIAVFIYGLLRFHSFDRNFSFILILLIGHSITVYFLNGKSGAALIVKQFLNILLASGVFFFYIKAEGYDLIEIFRKYINLAKLIAAIGFIQVLLFAFNQGDVFRILVPIESNISFRFQSATLEPSVVAYTLAPVFFLSLYNLINRRRFLIGRWWCFMFILAYLLTFSAVAYVGILLGLVILYFNRVTFQKLILAVFVLLAIVGIAYAPYRLMPEIAMRVDDTIYGLQNRFTDPEIYTSVNESTYAILSNLHVTKESLKDSPWLGNGIGTHQTTYDKHLPLDLRQFSSLNRKDANSLALRLLTETGIIGLGMFLYFLSHFRLNYRVASSSDEHKILWILNAGILIMLLLSLLRNGNYTIQGKLLFILMYYYSYLLVHSQLQANQTVKSDD